MGIKRHTRKKPFMKKNSHLIHCLFNNNAIIRPFFYLALIRIPWSKTLRAIIPSRDIRSHLNNTLLILSAVDSLEKNARYVQPGKTGVLDHPGRF
jgi:hypothetical protein